MIVGFVYEIVCRVTGLRYVGSTTKTLGRRLNGHRDHYKLWQAGKFNYVTSFDVLKNENYEVRLLERVDCENKKELHKRERHYIESLDCVNIVIPGRSMKEYNANYYNDHIEEIRAHKNQKLNCPCGGKYIQQNKARHERSKKHQNFLTSQRSFHLRPFPVQH